MDDQEKPEMPGRTSGDVVYAVVKASLAAVPIFGGSAAEVLELALRPPLEKRRDEWMKSVAMRLQDAELRLDNLANDPAFVTTLVQATQIAGRNHQEEKLNALRNAVLNSALPNPPSEDVRALFLNLVDELTPTHLRIMKLFDSPGSWRMDLRQSLASDREVTDQMILRLSNAGLLDDPRPYAAINRKHPDPLVNLEWTLSGLGKQFLRFISAED